MARDQRRRTQLSPDDVRRRLHERLADLDRGDADRGGTDPVEDGAVETARSRTARVTALADIGRVLRTALRLLLRHWPALLALALLGVAVRAAVLYAAIHVSNDHHVLGQLLLILGPPGFLIPIVFSFYVCRASLPRLVEIGEVRPEAMPTEGRPERLVDIAASVLIPFLALYESYGLLDDDISRFRNQAGFAEFGKAINGQHADLAGRLGIYSVPAAVGIVLGAWVVRWAVGLVERVLGLLFLAYLGAFADVFYTSQLAGQTIVLRDTGSQWVGGRNAAHWVESAYDWAENVLGFLAGPFRVVVDVGSGISTSWNEIILVPLAWLGIGAVILARQEADEEQEAAQEHAGGRHTADVRRQPAVVRVFLSLAADVRKRIGALWSALKLLSTAGLYPMLAFSLLLLVVVRLPAQLTPVVHVLVGPTLAATYLAFSPVLDNLELALSMAITVPLVAAAVDWLVTTRLERQGLVADLDARTSTPPGAVAAAAGQDGGTGSAT